METFWWQQWAQQDNLVSLWACQCRWFKEEPPAHLLPPALFSVSLLYIIAFIIPNSTVVVLYSCCLSLLSGTKHPSRCSTGSPHRLRRFRSCLVSFLSYHVNLHRTILKCMKSCWVSFDVNYVHEGTRSSQLHMISHSISEFSFSSCGKSVNKLE